MSNLASRASSVDGAVVAEAVEPETRRRRLLDAGGPVEDDEAARQKMREAEVGEDYEITGFRPDNVVDIRGLCGNIADFSRIKPMGYFAIRGDLPMMRWLYVNGADTRDEDVPLWYPMTAAVSSHDEEAVKWLFFHGAAKDLIRRNGVNDYWTPFNYLFVNGERSLIQWLILNGALCQDDNNSGMLDIRKLKAGLGRAARFQRSREKFADAREDLLEWAVELHQARFSFLTFIRGTLARREAKATSSLACLGGKSGIMELVAEYSGVVLGREAHIIRQLVELLPSIYKELEDIEECWANESESESESDGENNS